MKQDSMSNPNPNLFMQEAINQAKLALTQNEVPIGAVIVFEKKIIAKAFNSCETDKDALLHAEMKALKEASQVMGNWRLIDCDLYVTLEPCPMCLGALFQSRIRTLYFGCYDHKRLTTTHFPSLKGHTELKDNNHCLRIQGGILEKECSELLKDFFKRKR